MSSENLEGLDWTLSAMKVALYEPVLDFDNFEPSKHNGLRELTRLTEELGGYDKELANIGGSEDPDK